MKKFEVADKLDIAKDAALGLSVMTVIGNNQIYVENFKSIVEYENNIIKLLVKNGRITISGERLRIMFYNDEEICVRGQITKIEY